MRAPAAAAEKKKISKNVRVLPNLGKKEEENAYQKLPFVWSFAVCEVSWEKNIHGSLVSKSRKGISVDADGDGFEKGFSKKKD